MTIEKAGVFLLAAALVGVCHAQLNRGKLLAAFNQSPVFSHQRDRAVPIPQNMNIQLPVDDPAIQQQRLDIIPGAVNAIEAQATVQASSRVQPGPVVRENRNMGSVAAAQLRPVQERSRAQVNLQALQSNSGAPVMAGRPVMENDVVLGQVMPARQAQMSSVSSQTRQTQPEQPVVNDRMLNELRPAAMSASTDQQIANSKVECSFQIPSFLLPDPDPSQLGVNIRCPSFLLPGPSINPELVALMVEHWTGVTPATSSTQLNGVKSKISQVEFEQKCLLPALRAHVLGGPTCRTRELKVYLEWLLYLRQKLFNI